MRLLGGGAPVVAGDVADQLEVVSREPEELGGLDQVLGVLVVGAQVHVDADVVQQRRHLEQQPLVVPEPQLVAQLVEQPGGETGYLLGVGRVVAVALSQRLSGGHHLLAERLGSRAAISAHHVEQQPAPQGRVGHDDAARPGVREQLPIGNQRGDERLGVGLA